MKKILVGISGGVDSSVAALLLKEQGYEVIGATMAIWGKDGIYKKIQEKINNLPQINNKHGACFGPKEKEDIESAKKVCSQLEIPLHIFDCAKQYEEIVLKSFKSEYLIGRTPNPCVWCNALIKFNLLPYLAKLNGIKFDKFATGHYARVSLTKDKSGRFLLKRGIDIKKDQSYFLYRLSQEQLSNIILPLGDYTKEEIRKIAHKNNLNVADKPDSQDFYEGDYNELLEVEDKIGNIIDQNGKILGTHKGFWNYTKGQRKGLKISAKEPLYVIELRKDTNEVVVGVKNETLKNELIATKINWVSIPPQKESFKSYAKIRSSQEPQEVIVTPIENDNLKIEFIDAQTSIAEGQSVVLYDNDILLGGGIIDVVL